MSEEQRWAGSARESFAGALEHLRSRIRPLRAEIAELAITLDAKHEELAPLEQVEAELEKWCLEAGDQTTTPGGAAGNDERSAPGDPLMEPGSGQPTRCDLIIGLMSQDPEREWRPRDVACGLGETNVNTVRSLMQYMARRGRLHKNPDASYRIPSMGSDAATAEEARRPTASEEPDPSEQENVTHAPFGQARFQRPHTLAVDPDQVLRFMRKNAGRRWRPREVGSQLKIPDTDAVRETLMDLAGGGLLVKHNHGRFQYVPPGTSAGRAV